MVAVVELEAAATSCKRLRSRYLYDVVGPSIISPVGRSVGWLVR